MLKEIRVNNYPNKTNPYCNVIKEKRSQSLEEQVKLLCGGVI